MFFPASVLRTAVLLWLASEINPADCRKHVPPAVTQVYQYPDDTWIENLAILSSRHLLLTAFNIGSGSAAKLLTIDPDSVNPTPHVIAKLGNATALTGISALPGNRYAISGGEYGTFAFVNGTMSLFIVSIKGNPPTGSVIDAIPVPDTLMMNGMVAVPSQPFTVLSADGVGGRILRINTRTRQVDVTWADPSLLGPGGNTALPVGVNGLRIRHGWLYFTNSGQGLFARVRIDRAGNKVGSEVQIIAKLTGPVDLTNAFDDFDLSSDGAAYVALEGSSILKFTSRGVQTTLVAGGQGSAVVVKTPTSVAVEDDGRMLYVTTGGGQVLRVDLKPLKSN
ncbi:hypothetical protein B0H63DRAFT_474627 [Podospora didyma]|uniref:SMP-30/Gluconolactonase/LRE-like region domain-containing protein n=1 Tax=Podospora didyma TaxID=330526 RepID=A0AAE0NGA3_9PEZI|nr:hypothetical protein B0H63DRAFT_474627 [Podospora didyma]